MNQSTLFFKLGLNKKQLLQGSQRGGTVKR